MNRPKYNLMAGFSRGQWQGEYSEGNERGVVRCDSEVVARIESDCGQLDTDLISAAPDLALAGLDLFNFVQQFVSVHDTGYHRGDCPPCRMLDALSKANVVGLARKEAQR